MKKIELNTRLEAERAIVRKRKRSERRKPPKIGNCMPKYWYYDYHDIYILKLKNIFPIPRNSKVADNVYLPFCLRCLRYGHNEFMTPKPRYRPKSTAPCKPRYKRQSKYFEYRVKMIYLLNWYASYQSFTHHCANPNCTNPIHATIIFRKLRTVKWVNMFYNLLSKGIDLVFLCCKCHREKKYATLIAIKEEKIPFH